LAKGKKFERNLNEWKYLASQNDSFTPGKVHRCEVINPSFVLLRFSRRFVLIRVGYLSSSEAYTNNWCLFRKEYYLTFDWWKHVILLILRRSEGRINLTRPLASKWIFPLVLYSKKKFGRT
jgi:hypothetical protein